MRRRLEGAPLPITTLTFAGQNLRYNGNIDGSKNTRLVISGDLSYGGKAAVLSAAVAPGGALFGGHYRLYPVPDHTLSVSLAGDPHTLSDVGVFTNRGLLAPDVAAHLSAAPEYSFRQQSAVDRARFAMNLYGSKDVGSGWRISGEAGLEKGAHDHIASAMVNLNRAW